MKYGVNIVNQWSCNWNGCSAEYYALHPLNQAMTNPDFAFCMHDFRENGYYSKGGQEENQKVAYSHFLFPKYILLRSSVRGWITAY